MPGRRGERAKKCIVWKGKKLTKLDMIERGEGGEGEAIRKGKVNGGNRD